MIASTTQPPAHGVRSISKVRFRALFAIKRLACANKEFESEAGNGLPQEREERPLSIAELTTGSQDTFSDFRHGCAFHGILGGSSGTENC